MAQNTVLYYTCPSGVPFFYFIIIPYLLFNLNGGEELGEALGEALQFKPAVYSINWSESAVYRTTYKQ